jgi:hypothetical protein
VSLLAFYLIFSGLGWLGVAPAGDSLSVLGNSTIDNGFYQWLRGSEMGGESHFYK